MAWVRGRRAAPQKRQRAEPEPGATVRLLSLGMWCLQDVLALSCESKRWSAGTASEGWCTQQSAYGLHLLRPYTKARSSTENKQKLIPDMGVTFLDGTSA